MTHWKDLRMNGLEALGTWLCIFLALLAFVVGKETVGAIFTASGIVIASLSSKEKP
jgi:hypothetical protein